MLKGYVLTLSGASQALIAVFSNVNQEDVPCRTILLQPRGTNGSPIYIGAANQVPISATSHIFRLEPGTAGVPQPPFLLGEHERGPLRLSDFFVFGAAGEFLHIGLEPF